MVKGAKVGLVDRRHGVLETYDHRRDADWEATFYVEKEITKFWGRFFEYAGDFFQHDAPNKIAHLGTAYRITARQQVDFHFGFNVSDAAPRRFLLLDIQSGLTSWVVSSAQSGSVASRTGKYHAGRVRHGFVHFDR